MEKRNTGKVRESRQSRKSGKHDDRNGQNWLI